MMIMNGVFCRFPGSTGRASLEALRSALLESALLLQSILPFARGGQPGTIALLEIRCWLRRSVRPDWLPGSPRRPIRSHWTLSCKCKIASDPLAALCPLSCPLWLLLSPLCPMDALRNLVGCSLLPVPALYVLSPSVLVDTLSGCTLSSCMVRPRLLCLLADPSSLSVTSVS